LIYLNSDDNDTAVEALIVFVNQPGIANAHGAHRSREALGPASDAGSFLTAPRGIRLFAFERHFVQGIVMTSSKG
jgi:hypothetical protein